MMGCSDRYRRTWDAGVSGVQVRDGLTAGIQRIHLVVGQSDGAAPASRTPRIGDRQHVQSTLALRVHVSDTPSYLLASVERVVHHDDRTLVARRVELLYVAVLAYLCGPHTYMHSSCLLTTRCLYRFSAILCKNG